MDIQATLDAIELLNQTRFDKHTGKCDVATGILYSAARKLEQEAREALTGEKK